VLSENDLSVLNLVVAIQIKKSRPFASATTRRDGSYNLDLSSTCRGHTIIYSKMAEFLNMILFKNADTDFVTHTFL